MTTARIQLPSGLTIERVRDAARHNGAKDVRVFGSRAKGQARPDSDLDLLVALEPGRDLFDLIGFRQELEAQTTVRVEALTLGFLSPHLRDLVEAEAVAL